MRDQYKDNQGNNEEEIHFFLLDDLASDITRAVASATTRIVSNVTIWFITATVLLGGLWLAYRYLPQLAFYVILLVVLVDISLGITVRIIFSRRQ